MKFGTWSVRSLCRTGSLKTVASKVPKYNLDQMTIKEVIWDKDGSQPAEDYIFFMEMGMLNIA
jgi:hypothetical protein